MAAVRPPTSFANSRLDVHTVQPGKQFGRIYNASYSDPLGFGKSPSRFSDPRRRVAANRFGVLYLGESLKVCFVEAVLRDQRDGTIGALPIGEDELHRRRYAEIEVIAPLSLVDLRGSHAIRMGVPTDVHRASSQSLARQWSVAICNHPSSPDGIVYPSRLNGQTNLAVYDRVVSKLKVIRVRNLVAVPTLAKVLDDLLVELVPSD